MLIETCQIVAVTDIEMWLESRSKKDCALCQKGAGCGGGILAKLTKQSSFQFRLPRDSRASTSDYWQVAIPEHLLVVGAFLSYFLPLIFCLAAAISMPMLIGPVSDLAVAAVSVTALVGGHLVARRLAAKMDLSNHVQLIQQVGKPCYAS